MPRRRSAAICFQKQTNLRLGDAMFNEGHGMTPRDQQRMWDDWFARHGAAFLLFARQQTRSETEAQDVLQDVLLRLWQQGPAQPPDAPLVFHRIRLRAIDAARSQARRARREEAAAGEPGRAPWFEPAFGADDSALELEGLVRELPAEQRDVLTLKIWGELTFEQVGETLGISPNTAASRYRYALDALRKKLHPALP